MQAPLQPTFVGGKIHSLVQQRVHFLQILLLFFLPKPRRMATQESASLLPEGLIIQAHTLAKPPVFLCLSLCRSPPHPKVYTRVLALSPPAPNKGKSGVTTQIVPQQHQEQKQAYFPSETEPSPNPAEEQMGFPASLLPAAPSGLEIKERVKETMNSLLFQSEHLQSMGLH